MIVYIWLLLTIPRDRIICELWTGTIPTSAALIQACGTDVLDPYRLDVLSDGANVCSIPAASLTWIIEDCDLSGPLDAYRLRIVEPDYQEGICTVTTYTDAPPSWDVILAQCPTASKYGEGYVEIRLSATREIVDDPAMCLPPSIEQPASIVTYNDYYLLAGKLLWYGYADSQCLDGSAGVDPVTFGATPCGLSGARNLMIAWQNGLDESILSAARSWHVPADLIKQIIARETQFWPWTGIDGEHGLIQITEDGAGVVLHMYLPGYYQMSEARRHEMRIAWLNELDCVNCSPLEAYNHAKTTMNRYAQALAAYYCMFGSWDDALAKWNIKHARGQ